MDVCADEKTIRAYNYSTNDVISLKKQVRLKQLNFALSCLDVFKYYRDPCCSTLMSPTQLSTVILFLASGALGKTAQELYNILNLPYSCDKVREFEIKLFDCLRELLIDANWHHPSEMSLFKDEETKTDVTETNSVDNLIQLCKDEGINPLHELLKVADDLGRKNIKNEAQLDRILLKRKRTEEVQCVYQNAFHGANGISDRLRMNFRSFISVAAKPYPVDDRLNTFFTHSVNSCYGATLTEAQDEVIFERHRKAITDRIRRICPRVRIFIKFLSMNDMKKMNPMTIVAFQKFTTLWDRNVHTLRNDYLGTFRCYSGHNKVMPYIELQSTDFHYRYYKQKRLHVIAMPLCSGKLRLTLVIPRSNEQMKKLLLHYDESKHGLETKTSIRKQPFHRVIRPTLWSPPYVKENVINNPPPSTFKLKTVKKEEMNKPTPSKILQDVPKDDESSEYEYYSYDSQETENIVALKLSESLIALQQNKPRVFRRAHSIINESFLLEILSLWEPTNLRISMPKIDVTDIFYLSDFLQGFDSSHVFADKPPDNNYGGVSSSLKTYPREVKFGTYFRLDDAGATKGPPLKPTMKQIKKLKARIPIVQFVVKNNFLYYLHDVQLRSVLLAGNFTGEQTRVNEHSSRFLPLERIVERLEKLPELEEIESTN
ncbi:hypothetical protein SNEBB_007990 [Seison nebaliae]|nr:hypothetical protein SNEBB_007990 [Seison nebaliae]